MLTDIGQEEFSVNGASITSGAVRPDVRSAARNVVVFQCP